MIDVNFSSAVNNRTGKYFIGRDLIEDQSRYINKVYYWRYSAAQPPGKIASRLINKVMTFEHTSRIKGRVGAIGRRAHGRPMLHIDPFSVCYSDLHRDDIILCHDMGPITHPTVYSPAVVELYKWVYAYIARVDPRMVFVSKTSEQQYETLYGRTHSMTTIYPNLRDDVSSEAGEPVDGVARPFFLTVGNVGDRKNQARSIEAFAASRLVDKGYTYILCGGREPGYEAVKDLAASTPGVVLLPYVSDRQLIWLYKNADAFVLPSVLEGFGVPVAEAILHGLVPLVSQDSVLEEVAGPGAISVDPVSVDSIRIGFQRLADLQGPETSDRIATLKQSLQRFTRENFRSDWSRLIAG